MPAAPNLENSPKTARNQKPRPTTRSWTALTQRPNCAPHRRNRMRRRSEGREIHTMIRSITLLLILHMFASLGLAQDPLDPIRKDWRARKHQETYQATEIVRKQAYGKTLEVYYMGGTSLCRIPNLAELGVQYVQWILDRYQLSPSDRKTVNQELQYCRDRIAGTN